MKLIKIGSTWCPACIIMQPIFEEVDKRFNIQSIYYDYDIYEDMLKEKYHIGNKLPIIIFLDDNEKELDRLIGEIKLDDLINKINIYGDK